MAMKDRALVAAGWAGAIAAAICCTVSFLTVALAAFGLTAWLAKAAYAVIPALILCAGSIGFGLYRKQRRER